MVKKGRQFTSYSEFIALSKGKFPISLLFIVEEQAFVQYLLRFNFKRSKYPIIVCLIQVMNVYRLIVQL